MFVIGIVVIEEFYYCYVVFWVVEDWSVGVVF